MRIGMKTPSAYATSLRSAFRGEGVAEDLDESPAGPAGGGARLKREQNADSSRDFQVVFIYGPAAAGKHTIGSLVSRDTGWPLFHNHLTVDLVATLFDFGAEPFVELREEIWLAAFRAAAKGGRSFIFTFHPEASVRPRFIDDAHGALTAGGGRVHFVELVCSEAGVEARLDSESRARFGKLRDLELYRQLRESGSFDFPAMPEPAVRVDTETLEPEASARRIVESLGLPRAVLS